MTPDQITIFTLIAVILGLFIWGKWRSDVVALIGLFACAFLGLVESDKLFSGFGHPATITVAFVLVLSYGLTTSRALDGITVLVGKIADYPILHLITLMFLAAVLSMFINNIGALALLMPIAIHSSIQAKRSPSLVLMPLSFGSILGGMATLIGTPPNIIISKYRETVVGEPFSIFDFAPVGGPVAMIGILFLAIIGWRLVKIRRKQLPEDIFVVESYLFEMQIPEGSEIAEKKVSEFEDMLADFDLAMVTLIRGKQRFPVPPKYLNLMVGDVLVFEGRQTNVDNFVTKYNVKLLSADGAREAVLHQKDTMLMEAVVTPGSLIVDKKVSQVGFRHLHRINLLAIASKDETFQGKLRHLTIRAGDVLLLHGQEEEIMEGISRLGCYPLAESGIKFRKRRHAPLALFIFAAAIAAAAFGLVSTQVALGTAVVAMVLSNIIPAKELYDGIDWPVVVLLGAMIPVGAALESTGATKLIADGLYSISGDVPPYFILALILVVTMTLSDILNNAATAILMAPIAKDIAQNMGADPDAFLMAVAIGASSAFLTPIGHQNNTLVMGPGGYRFGDYWRLGLPLEIIIVLVAVPLLTIMWPL